MKVIIDQKKSVQENAASYFEKAKRAKKKLEGAKKAVQNTLELCKQANNEREISSKNKLEQPRQKRAKKEWYEKFRWFISSENYLIIGGKDATTNEIIIKKYTENSDLVFHTEIAGSPFIVIKNPEKKEIPENTINEAAEFCASFSRYWQRGVTFGDVYCIRPEQVSKTSQPGQYLAKGSFMIYGERKYFKPRINLAIGIYTKILSGNEEQRLITGPISAVKKICSKFAEIIQSNKKSSDTVKEIQAFFSEYDFSSDEILQILPPGAELKKN